MVSRVGADDLGREIRAACRALGLDDAYLQEDPAHATGTVTVALDGAGQPAFTITPDVAYDSLAWDDRLEVLFSRAQAVCFGTLVQRQADARQTVQRAVRTARNALVVFDVNLRQDHYGREAVEASLAASRWVKLNDDELVVLRDLLGLAGTSEPTTLADLRRRYDLELAALTRGERGCLIQTDDEQIAVPGERVQVVDTVGAGDAFTAGLLCGVLEGMPLEEAARFANRLAARVAASAGGTPRIDRHSLEEASA
jgi:fructokinase